MATELSMAALTRLFEEIKKDAEVRSRKAVTGLALAVEKQAKINASTGAHAYGTPTPAQPGTGPARISGNLVRSLTHTPVTLGSHGWETLVGTAVGFYPSYGTGVRTPANKYGLYLETGLKNGSTYPFLLPAFKFVAGYPSRLIYAEAFGSGWPRLP